MTWVGPERTTRSTWRWHESSSVPSLPSTPGYGGARRGSLTWLVPPNSNSSIPSGPRGAIQANCHPPQVPHEEPHLLFSGLIVGGSEDRRWVDRGGDGRRQVGVHELPSLTGDPERAID